MSLVLLLKKCERILKVQKPTMNLDEIVKTSFLKQISFHFLNGKTSFLFEK